MKRNVINGLKGFWIKDEGVGTLELLLIVAVLVVIAVAFRKWIVKWVGDLFGKANTNMDEIGNLKPEDVGNVPN